jgi:hypothetical protein
MATFTWYLQGSSDTEIESADLLQFAGGTFDSKITVDEYNDSTHVKTDEDADKSSANTPNNVKFVSQDGGGAGDSQADWGDGTEDLDAITEGECTLKINFSHTSAVAVSDAIYFAYKTGEATTVAPDDVDFRAAELGDTNFTEAEGSGDALALDDSASATSHDYFIAVSAGPTAVGEKSFKQRIELTYS